MHYTLRTTGGIPLATKSLLAVPTVKEGVIIENPKLTPDRAEQIINTLRDNPGVEMTLSDIADATGLPIDDLGAYLEDLTDRSMLLKRTTADGFDVYTFPVAFQRGSTSVDER